MATDRVEELLQAASARFGAKIQLEKVRGRRAYARVAPEDVPGILEFLYREENGRLCTVTAVERRAATELLYHVSVDRFGLVLNLRTLVEGPLGRMPSAATFLPAAAWIEREIRDLLGLEFAGHPDPRPLLRAEEWPEGEHPLRKGGGEP